MWKALVAPTSLSTETDAAAAVVLPLGKEDGERRGEKNSSNRQKDRLVVFTYSWTALSCCMPPV